MNPFLHDTVASPLPARPTGSWQFPFARASRARLGRQAGAVAMAAGIGMSAPAQAVDVNHASAAELQGLRGVGPRMAQMIVDERERAGQFESMEDLSDRVRGIGRKRLQSLRASGLRIGSTRNIQEIGANVSPGARASGRRSPHAAVQPLLTAVSPMP